MTFWSDLGSPIHQTYFIISIMVGIFSFYLSAMLFRKYIERRSRITAILTGYLLLLAIAVILDPIFLTIRNLMDVDYISLQGLYSFGLTAYANILLVIFLREVFYKKEMNWIVYLIIIIEALILPIALWLYYSNQDTIIILGLNLLVSFIIYLNQFIKSITLRIRIKMESPNDKVSYMGTTFIGFSGLMLFSAYVSFLLQEMNSFFGDLYENLGIIANGGSIFIPIGFFLSGIAAIFIYLGFVMPNWLKKRWEIA
jgi:hypothetical protein